MALFNCGKFMLHSGSETRYKIDCDYLSDEDVEAIASIIASKIHFKKVVGIPTGGLRLAAALSKFINKNSILTLVVDDVYTTGRSFEKYMRDYVITEGEEVYFAVMFNRSDTRKVLPNTKLISVFDMNQYFIQQ